MSKRFSFRLDGLHRYRQFKTNEAKLALGEIARLRADKQRAIEQLSHYLTTLRLKRAPQRVIDVQMDIAHAESVRHQISTLQTELHNLQEIETHRRRELTRTMKDEKVLDKLREKKRDEYDHSERLEEQNLMDEIALRMELGI